MKLSLKELNEVYYCISKVRRMSDEMKLIENKELDKLIEKLSNEIYKINKKELELDMKVRVGKMI